MTAPLQLSEYALRLTIHPAPEGGCILEPDVEYNFQIRNGDEIHMLRVLENGESLSVQLILGDEYETTIKGLSFGRTSEEAQQAEPVLDTGGAYYLDTPFQISPGLSGSAVFTVVNDAAEKRYSGSLWYFDVWPAGKGHHRIDPKIYNKGDGGDDGQ